MGQEPEEKEVPSCRQSHSGKGHTAHLLMMLLCCLVPLGLVLLVSKVGISSNLSWLISLICPWMMVGMMVIMCLPHKGKK